jgi:hypothetical protein
MKKKVKAKPSNTKLKERHNSFNKSFDDIDDIFNNTVEAPERMLSYEEFQKLDHNSFEYAALCGGSGAFPYAAYTDRMLNRLYAKKHGLTDTSDNDIISSNNSTNREEKFEDMNMKDPVKFHDQHCIYLYCAVDTDTANIMIQNKLAGVQQLKLYESSLLAVYMSKRCNISNPQVLRVAVEVAYEQGTYYDELTMPPKMIRNVSKSIDEYKDKSEYTRCLVREPDLKMSIIEYTVKNMKLIQSMQYYK